MPCPCRPAGIIVFRRSFNLKFRVGAGGASLNDLSLSALQVRTT